MVSVKNLLKNLSISSLLKKFSYKKSLKNTSAALEKKAQAIKSYNIPQNLKIRIISAIIAVPIVIYAIYFAPNLFLLLVLASAILMSFEYCEITKSAQNQKNWKIFGFFYVLIPVFCILEIYSRKNGADVILWMLAIIWSVDIFAYFGGKNFGGPKLAPTISPNKTISGLLCGTLAAAVIGFLSSFMFSVNSAIFFITVSTILAIIEQGGDLLESKIKRTFDVKDSGSIVPGHGGILDRLDGVILVAPAMLLIITIFSDKFFL